MKIKLLIIIITLVLLTVVGSVSWSYFFGAAEQSSVVTKACTEEAKLCADGSVVVRSGPECLFAACPGESAPTSSLEMKPEIAEVKITLPMTEALTRVTKKPFGLKVSPMKSPVSPERFNGYHTGADLEVTEAEQNVAVQVKAICTGEVKLKKWVSGYGGVLITSCDLDGESVTVLYGHLGLDSIKYKVADKISAGSLIGNLGRGYSAETDQERKHLHLAIHRGTATVLAGYVATAGQLSAWLDPMTYLTRADNVLK